MEKVSMAVSFLMLDALVRALAKQPGIDLPKLTADINASLVWKEVSAEQFAGAESLVPTARALFAAALPGLPTR